MDAALERLEDRTLLSAFLVNTTNDTVDVNPGDGLALDAAGKTSLRTAIMEANSLNGADEIVLSGGTYLLTMSGISENAAAAGDLDITDHLTIRGESASTSIIDASGLGDRVFQVHSGPSVSHPTVVVFENVTVAGGLASGSDINRLQDRGAGLDMDFRTDVTIRESVFRDNSAPRAATNSVYGLGGAIDSSGNLTILDSHFENNHASNAGGVIYIGGSGATTSIRNTTS